MAGPSSPALPAWPVPAMVVISYREDFCSAADKLWTGARAIRAAQNSAAAIGSM